MRNRRTGQNTDPEQRDTFDHLQVDEALAQLIDMGFDDENINRFMLIKNGLNISDTISDLIAEAVNDEAVVREQPRSNSVQGATGGTDTSSTNQTSTNNGADSRNNNSTLSPFLCDFD